LAEEDRVSTTGTVTRDATTANEEPVYFEADGRQLFGIVTSPTVEPLGIGVVLLTGGGVALSMNRNRLSVRMARRLAALGYHVIRFDYRGIGESEGMTEVFDLTRPFSDDLLGAVGELRARGIGRFVLVGACYGARTALACAGRIEGLEGLVLVAAPVRDFEMGQGQSTRLARDLSPIGYARYYLRRARERGLRQVVGDARLRRAALGVVKVKARAARDAQRGQGPAGTDADAWASDRYIDGCAEALRRGARLLILHGDHDGIWTEFERAMEGRLGAALGSEPQAVEVRVVPGPLHGYTRVPVQGWTLDTLVDWLSTAPLPAPARS
jgi:pimeloyl-ACP methyl ester carboxylesterase